MEFDVSQREALNKLKTGSILCGDVGSGKSRTALAYYFVVECGGSFEPSYSAMEWPKDLYIITTAKKRDSGEWDEEMIPFLLSQKEGVGQVNVTVDSWNNIGKYTDVVDSFFIFDEQRLVGSGAWVKAFYKITSSGGYSHRMSNNHWILLSATPGDCWSDYIPVFVANKFYKNKTQFLSRHAVYSRFTKYPRIDKYIDEKHLERLRDSILVDINFVKSTQRHYEDIEIDYDRAMFKSIAKTNFDPWTNEPIRQISGLFYCLRRCVNDNYHRLDALMDLHEEHKKTIVFYNFDYELEAIKSMCENAGILYKEWNGHKHEPLPDGEEWMYLVQYAAGCEGWNCIETDTIIFYSLNYSYRMTMQAAGRIDRRNTSYRDLYYYFLVTTSWIDRAIKKALNQKKNFNEKKYYNKF